MSHVDNCILAFDICEDEETKIEEVNIFFNGKCKPFISCEDPSLNVGWYGGSKALETPLYIAAFNCLEEDKFIIHLQNIEWKFPENVQLIIQRQDEDRFEIIQII